MEQNLIYRFSTQKKSFARFHAFHKLLTTPAGGQYPCKMLNRKRKRLSEPIHPQIHNRPCTDAVFTYCSPDRPWQARLPSAANYTQWPWLAPSWSQQTRQDTIKRLKNHTNQWTHWTASHKIGLHKINMPACAVVVSITISNPWLFPVQ